MERELIEAFGAATKAAFWAAVKGRGDSTAEEARCLDALKRVRKIPVNYHILQATKVGHSLRHMTKHPKKRIRSLAAEVIEMWKNTIKKEIESMKDESIDICEDDSAVTEAGEEERKNVPRVELIMKAGKIAKFKICGLRKLSSISTTPVAAKHSSSTTAEPPASHSLEKTGEESQSFVKNNTCGSAALRSTTSAATVALPNLTALPICNDASRDRVRKLLSDALCRVSGEAGEDVKDEVNGCDPFRVAVAVESLLFDKWGHCNGSKNSKYRSLLFNIRDSKNPDFRRKVLLGYVKPELILDMSSEDMASHRRQLENDMIRSKASLKRELKSPVITNTKQFRCSRCGNNDTAYSQMQTRSADEPMTTFVACAHCNYRWKFC